MPNAKMPSLKRAVHEIPKYVATALHEHNLKKDYDSRPPYQRNDYIGWITRAKLDATRQKRLNQMLSELKGKKIYMNMQYKPKSI